MMSMYLLHLGKDLLDRQVMQVAIQPELHNHHRLLNLWGAHYLHPCKRGEEDLFLLRELRAPLQWCPSVNHAHLRLKHDTRFIVGTGIIHCNAAVSSRGHECQLDSTAHIVIIGCPECVRQHTALACPNHSVYQYNEELQAQHARVIYRASRTIRIVRLWCAVPWYHDTP